MLTKEELPACPVATTVQMIGSKWKLLIMRNLLQRPWRFNELKKDLEGISQKVLTDSLRSMEADGIITRTVYPEVPPRVEYALSDLGESMRPIMDAMEIWGTEYKNRRNKKHQACRSNSTGLMFSCFLYHSQKSGSGRWADANQKPRYSTGAARGNNFPARGAAVPFHRFFPFVSATLAYQTALSLGVRLPVA